MHRCSSDNEPPAPEDDDKLGFVARVEEAAMRNEAVELTGTTALATRTVLSAPAVRLRGDGQAVMEVFGRSIGCEIRPEPVEAGAVRPAPEGAESIRLRRESFTRDEWAGAWVEIIDPNARPNRMSRRIISNSARELVLDQPLGRSVTRGSTARLFRPLDEVTIENLQIQRRRTGGTNLLIQYCNNVRITDVTSSDGGEVDSRRGNGISIMHCNDVEVLSTTTERSGNFGLFVYNSDDVLVDRYAARLWGGQFGVQLKDCRRGVIRAATCEADRDSGDNGVSLKCSGLNAAVDLRAEDCLVSGTRQGSFEFSSITNEGTYFSAETFRFYRCRSAAPKTHGFSCVLDAVAVPTGWEWNACVSEDAGRVGFNRPAAGHRLIDCVAERSFAEGAVIAQPQVAVVGGRFEDNSRGAAPQTGVNAAEIAVEADDVTIRDVTFTRSALGGANYAIVSTSAGTVNVSGSKVRDSVGAYTAEYSVRETD